MTTASNTASAVLDLDVIEARAKAATPGPWSGGHRCDGAIRAGASGDRFSLADVYAQADAAHIAGMDPPTTLALVATIRALEAERDAMREALKPFARYIVAVDPKGKLLNTSEFGDKLVGGVRMTIKFGDLRRAAALVHSMAEVDR